MNQQYWQDDISFTRIADSETIYAVLVDCQDAYQPPLGEIIDNMHEYALKLARHAEVYVAAAAETLGFIAFYANDFAPGFAYIALLAVKPLARGHGIGTRLLLLCEQVAQQRGLTRIRLEVRQTNLVAQALYRRVGYQETEPVHAGKIYMEKQLSDQVFCLSRQQQ